MICAFCKAEFSKLNRDGFCRKCGPIIRKGIREQRQRNRVLARFCGPPTYQAYCQEIRKLARVKVRHAIARGTLNDLRKNYVQCVDCGDRATVHEHRDYTRPLMVEPTCKSCNSRRRTAYPHPTLPFQPNQDDAA